jgi:hypothetical protein
MSVIITKLRGHILESKTGARLSIAKAGRLGWKAVRGALAAGKLGLNFKVTGLKIRTISQFSRVPPDF